MDGGVRYPRLVGGSEAFTVLGATGFIGSHMVRFLRAAGHPVYAPRRNAPGAFDHPLGHVIYAIGLTADFRERPIATMEAHVSVLSELLRVGRFESFTYLSSTRVYAGVREGHEDAPLTVNPAEPNDLYNLSKLAGEALCLSQDDPRIRIARLANVYGVGMDSRDRPSDNFLAVLARAAATGRIVLRTAPESSKDYVAVEDVARALHAIALKGRHRIYNVASGRNVTHAAIAATLSQLTGCRVETAPGAPAVVYPPIDTRRIRSLFPAESPWAPADVLDRLSDLLPACRVTPAAIAGEVP